jgi:hypothetical protein
MNNNMIAECPTADCNRLRDIKNKIAFVKMNSILTLYTLKTQRVNPHKMQSQCYFLSIFHYQSVTKLTTASSIQTTVVTG